MKKSLATLLTALILLSCGWTPACIAEPTETDAVWEQVSEAYIYAFPLVLTNATKTMSTNTDGSVTGRAPVNQINHAKKLADASFRTVVTPNVDTLYSQAWLDIGAEPMVYVLPETDRFCNVQLLDAWTNTAAVLCCYYDRNTLTLPRRLYGNTNRRSVLPSYYSFSVA